MLKGIPLSFAHPQKGPEKNLRPFGPHRYSGSLAAFDYEVQRALIRVDPDVVAVQHAAIEDSHRQRVLHEALDRALQRTRAIRFVVAGLEDRLACRVAERQRNPAVNQHFLQAAGRRREVVLQVSWGSGWEDTIAAKAV